MHSAQRRLEVPAPSTPAFMFWRGDSIVPLKTHLLALLIIQGVCAILIFNKYTNFWQFAYLILLSMWKYTYFQPKWLKRQKLGNIWRNCLQLMKFLDILRIFCSFSYLKSYVLFKTEQKLTEGRMKISLWLKFFGQFFKFIDVSRIFCSFSYLKSYVLFKTEQKLTEVRMKMSLWLKFFGAIFKRFFCLTSSTNETYAKIYLFSIQK